jgi:hypothetical protein
LAKQGQVHAVAPGKKINEPADGEVLNHRSIAVEKNHARGSRVSPLPIVHAAASHSMNVPSGGFLSFFAGGDRGDKVLKDIRRSQQWTASEDAPSSVLRDPA